MMVTRYIALDARTGELAGDRAYRSLDELEVDAAFLNRPVIPHRIAVDVAPPPLGVATLAADATLVVSVSSDATPEAIHDVASGLEERLGDRFVVLAADGTGIATSGPQAPQEEPERLPWSHYGPELTIGLKKLIERFPHRTVADAAATLADMMDEHGPEAVAEARREARREAFADDLAYRERARANRRAK